MPGRRRSAIDDDRKSYKSSTIVKEIHDPDYSTLSQQFSCRVPVGQTHLTAYLFEIVS